MFPNPALSDDLATLEFLRVYLSIDQPEYRQRLLNLARDYAGRCASAAGNEEHLENKGPL